MVNIILANVFFFFFIENAESTIGIKNNNGSNKTESPGKSFQDKGSSIIINQLHSPKTNSVIIEAKFNV